LVRLFREHSYDVPAHVKGHRSANKLLGIPNNVYPDFGYIGQVVTWKRDNVLKLYHKLESISKKGWVQTLASSWHLAEYILYGVFVDNFLKEESGHYHDSQKIVHEYWEPKPLSDEELQQFFSRIKPEHVAVMISAKSGMPVERYQHLAKMIPTV
jgi:hypothetical protein